MREILKAEPRGVAGGSRGLSQRIVRCPGTGAHLVSLVSPQRLNQYGLWIFFLILIFFNFYLFMAVLGLHFCARAFSSCGKRGPLFIAVRGPLTIAAPLVVEHRLQTRRLSSCGSRAQLLCGMWGLPRPGPEPMSPALAGRLSTTVPPGKPWFVDLNKLGAFGASFWDNPNSSVIFSWFMCHCGRSVLRLGWGLPPT